MSPLRARFGVFDVLVVGVAVVAELEIVLRDLPGPTWLLLPAVWLYTLPLLARFRWPLGAPLFVIVVQVLVSFMDLPAVTASSRGWSPMCLRSGCWATATGCPARSSAWS